MIHFVLSKKQKLEAFCKKIQTIRERNCDAREKQGSNFYHGRLEMENEVKIDEEKEELGVERTGGGIEKEGRDLYSEWIRRREKKTIEMDCESEKRREKNRSRKEEKRNEWIFDRIE